MMVYYIFFKNDGTYTLKNLLKLSTKISIKY